MNKWDAAQFFPWWGQAIPQALGIVMDKHLTQKCLQIMLSQHVVFVSKLS